MLKNSVSNPSIGAGELVHAISIAAPDPAGDSYGESIVPAQWNVIRATRAAIATAGGRETNQASQLVSEVSHVVTIRYTPTLIAPGYQVQFGARRFRIQYVENVGERNRVLMLYCLEVDALI
jgi:SPP1 family predicted phage head-tail adaptor